MIVTIGKEVFDFLQWKKVGHSFCVRRSDGELRVVALVGSGLPLRSAWFRCEFGDGTTIGFNAYKLSPLSLSEISQLQNVLQESRENKLAEKAGKLTVATELSAKRSAAGRNRAMITDEGDREKIRAAFFRRVDRGISKSAAARALAELISEDNPLGLEQGPYYVSADTVKRIVGVRR